MKKFFSLLLALVLVYSLSGAVFADSGKTDYNWDDVGGAVLESFADLTNYISISEVDATMWVPSYFSIAELTEEDVADNCIGYLINNDGSAFILFYYMDMPVSSLDALFSSYQASGYNARKITVNGVPSLLSSDAESNSLFLSYQTQEGKLFQIYFYPASDESYSVIYDFMIASILPNSAEETVDVSEPVVSTNPVSGLISK